MRPFVLTALAVLTLCSPFTVLANNAKEAQDTSQLSSQLRAYSVVATTDQALRMRAKQYDISNFSRGTNKLIQMEVIMTPEQAQALKREGVEVVLKQRQTAGTRSQSAPIYRPYGGSGGLQEEVIALAEQYPDLTDLEVIGQSALGADILAIKVGKEPKGTKSSPRLGSRKLKTRPSVLYVSTQHAREWVTPEVNRRLLKYFLENYGSDSLVKSIVDTTDLWFVLVANPDGYDYTFTEGNRLWRKNLADNDGDGQITISDGVDLNRNFSAFWGINNEGSSPEFLSGAYRGPSPSSEPETNALDRFVEKLRPQFLINYHSAAELILYGVGYQVATPTPDNVIAEALVGDNANPAIAGFDPDIISELTIANGDTNVHVASVHGVISFTPELTRCQTVAADPFSCESVFNFPEDEALIEAEFQKNLPFALDVAQSAINPFEPVSHLGNTVEDFIVDEFAVSHGKAQTVQANISRQIRFPFLFYRVNDGRTRIAWTKEWQGGERYGGDFNTYYRQVRGNVRGLNPGDTVEYWFAGFTRRGFAKSESASFNVAEKPQQVLVIANEDYDGFTPEQFESEPKFLGYYTSALESNGATYNLWDMDANGAPHALGVLSHYDAVIWYVGDNIITQDLEDRDLLFPNSELGVAEVMQFTTIAVRDYLNEGGRLLKTGDRAGYFGQFNILFYGEDTDPTQPCEAGGGNFAQCLIFSDDFHQYWLGDFNWSAYGNPEQVLGRSGSILDGVALDINGASSANNSFDAGLSLLTSSILPPEQFPSIPESRPLGVYQAQVSGPFVPLSGDFYIGVLAQRNQYNRISRTLDLSDTSTAKLDFSTIFDLQSSVDLFVVEVHELGTDNWTTLNDTNGNTPDFPLLACTSGLWNTHPFIFDHYVDQSTCLSPGSTGEFHSFTGLTANWINASFDLTPFAGKQIEIHLSHISDPSFSNVGVFVDDLMISKDGETETQDWEASQTPWSASPPPPGSPDSTTDWERSTGLTKEVFAAGVETDSTIYLPYGFEAISTQTQRHELMKRFLDHLLD